MSLHDESADVLSARIQRVLDWLGHYGHGSCDEEDCDEINAGGHKGSCMGVIEDILRGRST